MRRQKLQRKPRKSNFNLIFSRLMAKRLLILFPLAFFLASIFISTVIALSFPKPSGYVNDFANILSSETKKGLEDKLVNLEKESSIEIAVVTVSSLEGTTVEDYAVRLFEEWKIGKKGKDNGVLILVAPNEREIRIEVGYGLESILTDSRAGRIIRNIITPEFKKNNYDTGITKGVEAIIAVLLNKEVEQVDSPVVKNIELLLPFIIFGSIVLFSYLAAFLGRSKEIWPGGIIGAVFGGGAGLILSTFAVALAGAIFLGLVGLFLDFILSYTYQIRKKSGLPTSWTRSWGGFSSGGGSSFGGFGGGSSGGGGASGKW